MRKAFSNVLFLWKIYGLDFGTMEGFFECVSYIRLFSVAHWTRWLWPIWYGSGVHTKVTISWFQPVISLIWSLPHTWWLLSMVWLRWQDDVELLVIWRLTHPIGALEIVMYGNLKDKSYKILKGESNRSGICNSTHFGK